MQTSNHVAAMRSYRFAFAALTASVLGSAVADEKPQATQSGGGYLVVVTADDQADDDQGAFRKVAQQAAAFHKAELIEFDGDDFERLEATLTARKPRNVLFIVPPTMLDCNFHRRIFMLCHQLDDDIFADFAFGYLTARDGEQLQRLWERTETLLRNGLAGKTWVEASVTSGMKSTTYPDGGLSITQAAGFHGPHIYWAEAGSDPDVLAFVERALPELEKADVLVLSGNGDPQGIWLFDDARNADESKHWDYAPEKVGFDPKNEMPRITAERIARLKLKSPIVWSGTCHCASPCNVYVESDIISTFGRAATTVLHKLKPADSLCLAIIDAGAAAFLAPVGSNHGYSTINEAQFALQNGATLGEAILSTYNDVLLASRGRPGLAQYVPGRQHVEPAGSIMWSAGANRILIGDPALAPFQQTADPLEQVEIADKRTDGFDVRVEWKEGFHPYTWDIFGVDHQRDGRVYVRIELTPDQVGESGSAERFTAEVEATDLANVALPLRMTQVVVEEFHGRRFLHLQANAPRASIDRKQIQVTFHVKRAD